MIDPPEVPRIAVNLAAGSKSPPVHIILARLLWNLTWLLFFRPLPLRIGYRWRVFLLKVFGAKIGSGVLVSSDVRIMKPWELEIGSGSGIGARVIVYNFCKVTIGSMAVVSQDCYLCTGSHDYKNPHMPLITKPIEIGSNSWIAAGTFICPGVKVGAGTVVAARSVVTKDLPEGMVCGGNPCRVIKPRVMIT